MATVVEQPAETKVSAPVVEGPRRFTVEEYRLMGETGVFRPDERIELLEGGIYRMSPKGKKHVVSTTRANNCFRKHLGDRAIIRSQDPIKLGERSEPEPDVALLSPDEQEYVDRDPTPQEILYVLEIADTTLTYDRTIKAPLYAQAGIIQYGILNVNARELEDYRDPDDSGYRTKHTYRTDESFTLVAFREVRITISELLPPE
jgi:Uma2 family endonuclease